MEGDPTSGFGQSPGITKYCPCALSGEVTVTLVPVNLAPPPPPAAADATAELTALSIGGLAMNPDFSPRVYEYSATATAATTSVIVSFTLLGAGASVSFTAEPKAPGAVSPASDGGGDGIKSGSSPSLALAVGDNTVTVRVTSADLSDTRVYSFTVTRLAFELNAELGGLSVAINGAGGEGDAVGAGVRARLFYVFASSGIRDERGDVVADV